MSRELSKTVNTSNKWMLCDEKIILFLNSLKGRLNSSSKPYKFNLYSFSLICFSFLKLMHLFLFQYFSMRINNKEIPEDILIETLANHHHKNYFKFINKNKEKSYLLIKCFEKKNLTAVLRLSFVEIFSYYSKNLSEINNLLSTKMPKDLMKLIESNAYKILPIYSYYCALLKGLKNKNPQIKIYHGGAELFSIASELLNVKNCLLSHGLLVETNKLIIPKYNEVFLYSKEEVEYLKKLKVKSKVFIYPFKEILKKEKKVIIFLNPDNRTSDKEISNLIKSIKLFKSFKYEILLKKHPFSKGVLAKELSDSLDLKIDNSLLDGNSILVREYPSFVIAAGLSTVICESLNAGIIPICASETEKNRYDLRACPYPFKKRSFFWDDENLEIKYLLENISYYPKYIEKLRTR